MKVFSALFILLLSVTSNLKANDWETDFAKAQAAAAANGKMILLSFSGSDWCQPCIKMKKQIFDSDAFKAFADEKLILVKADFPRTKKNKLPAAQTKANGALAAKYNKKGSFPFTVLLDAKGNIIKSWDGMPKDDAAKFVAQIKNFVK